MYVLLISYVAGEQLITPMKAQPRVALAASFPSSTVTGEDNIITDYQMYLPYRAGCRPCS